MSPQAATQPASPRHFRLALFWAVLGAVGVLAYAMLSHLCADLVLQGFGSLMAR